jgi:GMP synthase (glutamine-hydrolysing)
MPTDRQRPLLIVRHVFWEGPHRLLEAFRGKPVIEVNVLDGEGELPQIADVAGAVFMGGPMSANDTGNHPVLVGEIEWLRSAVAARLPVLGICLGAQLLARALGAQVRPGTAEIGWAPVQILEPSDALLGHLAPSTVVLHWHSEVFELPPGTTALARSRLTACQAFRYRENAWGVLFHPEADRRLLRRWLSEPTMAGEADSTLGPQSATILEQMAAGAEPALVPRTQRLFAEFARRCRRRASC